MEKDEGIGMIEIVVAMFILALIAISFLPVLTNNLLAARQSNETATATQIVSAQLEGIRQGAASCDRVADFSTTTIATVGSQRFTVVRSNPGGCTAPGETTVAVAVSPVDSGTVVADAQTRLFVGAP